MPKPFFSRLVEYYNAVAAVLRGESDAANIFGNTIDKGGAREQLYVDFLRNHLPSTCNVKLGGLVFNQAGEESKQIDVIVSSDMCPQFNMRQKSFSCIDGVLAVVSIKSMLNSHGIRDAITNIASVPQHRIDYPWDKVVIDNPMIDMWPLKVIYAIDGVSVETLQKTISKFNHPTQTIPKNRLPDVIHVAGKYSLRRSWVDIVHEGRAIPACHYVTMTAEVDAACLAFVVERIQQLCLASRFVPYNFGDYVYRMFGTEPPAV